MRKRVPNPQEVIKIRRLAKGEPVHLTGTVVKVSDDEPGRRKVTFRLAGYPIPITLSEDTLTKGDA
jgi:hypothetical protein